MSRMLNMADHLLVRGRKLQQVGRFADAAGVLGKLAGLRELPPDVAQETQGRLAELLLERGRPKEARRHLTAALTVEPGSARYHLLMARALEDEKTGDPARALEHYRMSLAAEPDQPQGLSEAGQLAVRLGKTDEGLADLRRAIELEPRNAELLQALVAALCELGRIDEARRALLAGMFRNPRDRRFRREWDDFRFQRLHDERKAFHERRAGERNSESGPVLLPFVRPVTGIPRSPSGSTIRRHGASPTPAPHFPSSRRLPGRKHA